MAQSIRRAVQATVLVVALSACTEPTASPSPSPAAGGPLALFPASLESAGAAQPAQLLLDGECFYLASAGERWLAVWPYPGTELTGSAVTVNGTAVAIGGEAVFGGGEAPLQADNVSNYEWVNPPSSACLTGKGWWITHIERR